MRYRVGIDVGGTFTDLALLSEEGLLYVSKVPTRPEDIASACLGGLADLLAEVGAAPNQVDYWSHGTTVATNAVLERKGAKMALLVTKGFRDILEIRRQIKPDRYNLHKLKPEPLVPRDRRLEVNERILWDGSIHMPMDETELEAVLDQLEDLEVEAVAICFLHAYANPKHERMMLERIESRLSHAYLSSSHEVLPEFREYSRCATTVTNAYVGPVVKRYLERFDDGGQAMGIRSPLTIFQSNGGIASASAASQLPLKILFSGPAAGVQGAMRVAGEAGYANLITFDMGGTSCDVCLIRSGVPLLTAEKELAGFPVRSPMVDVLSIGAGGGSLAWIDKGGLLQVGPESAGADPGPACYGQGGVAATVTDANVVLGRLHPDALLGGRLKIDSKRARDAVDTLTQQLRLTLEEVALGILDVVNSNMMGAIRVVSVERGYDYREFALMAFGGAGPVHAADIAREMGIQTVLVPPAPGILCAMGLLLADYRGDFTQTRILRAKAGHWREIREVFAGLEARAQKWILEHGIPSDNSDMQRKIQMRYVGQSYQLPVPTSPIDGPSDIEMLLDAFHQAHLMAFGYANERAPVEAVDFHLTLVVRVPRQDRMTPKGRGPQNLAEPRLGERLVWFKPHRNPLSTPIYRRDLLSPGDTLEGPAILEQLDSTTVVPPQAEAVVDDYGNIRIALF